MLPPLDIIKVTHVASIRVSTSRRKGILSITPQQEPKALECLGKKPRSMKEKATFDNKDLEGPPNHTTTCWS